MTEKKIEELAINKIFTQDELVNGYHGYHNGNLPNNKLVKANSDGLNIGIELEVYFSTHEDREKFTNIKTNWYKCESDSSLHDGYGCEIITLPMPWKEAIKPKTWDKLTKLLLHFGARSWTSQCCGLHVHCSAVSLMKDSEVPSFINRNCVFAGLGESGRRYTTEDYVAEDRYLDALRERKKEAQFLYKLCMEGYGFVDKVFGRSHGRQYATDITNYTAGHVKALNLKEIPEHVKEAMKDEANSSRYTAFNIRNTQTVEFRQGKGSIKADRIASVCLMCAAFMKFAASKLQAKKLRIENGEFLSYLKSKTNTSHPLFAMLNGAEEN